MTTAAKNVPEGEEDAHLHPSSTKLFEGNGDEAAKIHARIRNAIHIEHGNR